MKNWVIGNWKMNGSWDMVAGYVPNLLDGLLELPGWETRVRVGLCPPAVYLDTMVRHLSGYAVQVGAQNVYEKPNGAYTGEVSAEMLAETGVKFCLVGHSERRQYFGEAEQQTSAKVRALLEADLTPVLCVGETLDMREANRHQEVVRGQLQGGIAGLDAGQLSGLLIAYEPVWAIGTGVNATPEQANDMHAFIRSTLAEIMGADEAQGVPILYGGSVKGENAGELMGQKEINGVLVGGASLDPDGLIAIISRSI
ncbi:MAG: triose-phosphate isomerase [Deltaproteobacteria bacterium]|nr:triose-phosphate isomerase [Deltaproteobacteria bacterium]